MKRLILAASAAALALAPAAALAQRNPAATIVVVDTTRVFSECTACVAASNQLQGQVTALQQQRQTLGAPLQAEMQSIQQAAQAANAQTGAARTTAEQAIQTRLQALQQRENAANQQLSNSEQLIRSTQAHVSQQINTRLQPIYNQVMAAHGANIVLPKDATLASTAALDVTNEVLAALNQQLPAVSVTPLPQQAQPAAAPGAQPQPAQPNRPRPQGR